MSSKEPGQNNASSTAPGGSIPLTETTPESIAAEQSLGGLIKDATTHLSTLLRAEIELAKIELFAEAKKGLLGSVYLIIALTIVLFSSFFFFFAVAELLADLGLYRSAAFGIVWFAMLVVAAVLVLLGIRRFKRIKAPEHTINSMRDTAAALRRSSDDSETI